MGLLTKLIPSWVPIVILLVLSSVFTSLHSMKNTEIAKLKQQISDTATTQSKHLVVKNKEVRKTETSLNDGAAITRKETNDQVRAITRERDALLKRVRDAESRAKPSNPVVSQTSPATSDGEVATGDVGGEFLNQLGEEDVLEAERADVIRLHLKACYRDYDRAKEALEQMK